MTEEEATIQMNEMTFPEVNEGDTAYYEEYRFVYRTDTWVQEDA
mgnify:CR=1 FL=1|jgi:hypothetical protein|tara:strand:+ start:383 stop:514 length:132 start_codon:yes stop_codon:yes gene_type:complete